MDGDDYFPSCDRRNEMYFLVSKLKTFFFPLIALGGSEYIKSYGGGFSHFYNPTLSYSQARTVKACNLVSSFTSEASYVFGRELRNSHQKP